MSAVMAGEPGEMSAGLCRFCFVPLQDPSDRALPRSTQLPSIHLPPPAGRGPAQRSGLAPRPARNCSTRRARARADSVSRAGPRFRQHLGGDRMPKHHSSNSSTTDAARRPPPEPPNRPRPDHAAGIRLDNQNNRTVGERVPRFSRLHFSRRSRTLTASASEAGGARPRRRRTRVFGLRQPWERAYQPGHPAKLFQAKGKRTPRSSHLDVIHGRSLARNTARPARLRRQVITTEEGTGTSSATTCRSSSYRDAMKSRTWCTPSSRTRSPIARTESHLRFHQLSPSAIHMALAFSPWGIPPTSCRCAAQRHTYRWVNSQGDGVLVEVSLDPNNERNLTQAEADAIQARTSTTNPGSLRGIERGEFPSGR